MSSTGQGQWVCRREGGCGDGGCGKQCSKKDIRNCFIPPHRRLLPLPISVLDLFNLHGFTTSVIVAIARKTASRGPLACLPLLLALCLVSFLSISLSSSFTAYCLTYFYVSLIFFSTWYSVPCPCLLFCFCRKQKGVYVGYDVLCTPRCMSVWWSDTAFTMPGVAHWNEMRTIIMRDIDQMVGRMIAMCVSVSTTLAQISKAIQSDSKRFKATQSDSK